MEREKEIANNLHKASKGYGLSYEDILKCIEAIPKDLLEEFLYTLSRIAEKSGYYEILGDGESNY